MGNPGLLTAFRWCYIYRGVCVPIVWGEEVRVWSWIMTNKFIREGPNGPIWWIRTCVDRSDRGRSQVLPGMSSKVALDPFRLLTCYDVSSFFGSEHSVVCLRGSVRYGEIWWDMVIYGEIWWDMERYGGYGEICWDMVRYGEIWSLVSDISKAHFQSYNSSSWVCLNPAAAVIHDAAVLAPCCCCLLLPLLPPCTWPLPLLLLHPAAPAAPCCPCCCPMHLLLLLLLINDACVMLNQQQRLRVFCDDSRILWQPFDGQVRQRHCTESLL